jgi:hypothetical protein
MSLCKHRLVGLLLNRELAVIIGISLPTIALAKPYMDRAISKHSGASGIEAQITLVEILPDSGAYALRGFQFLLDQGKTCLVKSIAGTLPGREDTKQAPSSPSTGLAYTLATGDAKYSPQVVRSGSQYFVRGVQVCTQATATTSQRSIRGVKLFYARVKEDGAVERLDDPESWVNATGCEKWEDKVVCPDNMIAIGFRAHLESYGYRALGLKCSPVVNRD